MKTWLKGGLIGGGVGILLWILFQIFGYGYTCSGFDSLDGAMCTNSVQDIILSIFYVVGFPVVVIGATPNLSTFGPNVVSLFWLGSIICFILWGMLIGFIISMIKKK
ncbi:MAG: hypothetical protein AABW50_05030 [Nanoarchaeota archaeon]